MCVSCAIYWNDFTAVIPIAFFSTVTSEAPGSFSTAGPLSAVSLSSPLSPFSPVLGSYISPNKQLRPEVGTAHTHSNRPLVYGVRVHTCTLNITLFVCNEYKSLELYERTFPKHFTTLCDFKSLRFMRLK